jgi:glycosidase
VKLAFVLQMTFSGTPSVYYGSEIGLFGENDGNRQCMVWDEVKQNLDLKAHVKQLIKLRHEHQAFKSVDLKWLDLGSNSEVLGYEKCSENGSVYCLFNFSDESAEIIVPKCLQGIKMDLYGQKKICLESTMNIEPWGFAILK